MPLFRSTAVAAIALTLAGCAPAPQSAPPSPGVAGAYQVPSLAPGAPISREEYAARRAALAAQMEDGVLVVLGAPETEADYHSFAQTPDFRYLTGVTEPGAALVMAKRGATVETRLFVLERDPAREVWEGPRLGAEGAQALTGIPTTTVDRLDATVAELLKSHGTLYTLVEVPRQPEPGAVLSREQQVIRALAAARPDVRMVSLFDALQRLRSAKSPAELDLIRRAVYITTLAQREALAAMAPGMNEFEILALIEYTFRRHGAERPSFSTIVGSGPNSTTLHYRSGDRFMNAGEVVVMDVGASYRGYAADVTRTIPVSGTFSADQRAIYDIVLAAQKAAEAVVRPGASAREMNAAANRVLGEGLARLGLIEAPDATYDCATGRCPQYRIFYMHGLGHGIGLEVHDPDVSYYGPFGVGSAFTIEPGIYVRSDALDFLPDTPGNRAMIERLRPAVRRYQNIGVRIEDDYFVTPEGVERVSAGAPREVAEIEALMRVPRPTDRRGEIVEWYRATAPR